MNINDTNNYFDADQMIEQFEKENAEAAVDIGKFKWKSGGKRNQHGSLKKFYDSRSYVIFMSKWPELEDGKIKWRSETMNIGRNKLKRVAKDLGKRHGIPYGQSRRMLEENIKQIEQGQEQPKEQEDA